MNSITNIIDMIFRIGLIFLVSGIMVGLLFGEWTVMLVVGVLFTFSPIIQKGIQLRKESMTQEESIS
jgi:uncharacterized membrane protein